MARHESLPTAVGRMVPVLAVIAMGWAGPTFGQMPIFVGKMPEITEITAKGEKRTLDESEIFELEVRLYDRLRRLDAPGDLIALRTFECGGFLSLLEIALRDDESELRLYVDDTGVRYFRRTLSGKEAEALRKYVCDHRVDELPNYETRIYDGVEYWYYHFTKEGGHRLTINNPDQGVYGGLVDMLEELSEPDKLEVCYVFKGAASGEKPLFAHPEIEICAVWAEGDDVRVRIREYQPIWCKLTDGRIGADAEPPPLFAPCPWICHPGPDAAGVIEGTVTNHLTTADGRWMLGTMAGGLVCYGFREGKTVPMSDPELLTHYFALCDLPSHNKVLLRRKPTYDGRRLQSTNRRGRCTRSTKGISSVSTCHRCSTRRMGPRPVTTFSDRRLTRPLDATRRRRVRGSGPRGNDWKRSAEPRTLTAGPDNIPLAAFAPTR